MLEERTLQIRIPWIRDRVSPIRGQGLWLPSFGFRESGSRFLLRPMVAVERENSSSLYWWAGYGTCRTERSLSSQQTYGWRPTVGSIIIYTEPTMYRARTLQGARKWSGRERECNHTLVYYKALKDERETLIH